MLPLSPLLRPKKFTRLSNQETGQEEGIIPASYGSTLAGSAATGESAFAGKSKGFTVGGTFYNVEHPMAGMKGTKWENYPKINAPTMVGAQEEEDGNLNTNSLLQKSFRKIVG